MPRVIRDDDIGSWHHVMNRGIARRPVFESRTDVRLFLSKVARIVRRGDLELHAYAVMTTHFHLLVRSPCGHLSKALAWVELEYVRWFNRSRKRDGPLFRGRFRSCPITNDVYRRTIELYVDANPVTARLVTAAADYPWCSAHHQQRASWPRWLAGRPVDSGRDRSAASDASAGAEGDVKTAVWLVERRLRSRRGRDLQDPFDELVHSSPSRVLDWMRRKARIADGTTPGLPVATPDAVLQALGPPVGADRRRRATTSGLLRSLCGLEWREIGALLQISSTTAHDAAVEHQRSLLIDSGYAAAVAEVAAAVIGGWSGRVGQSVRKTSA